MIRKLVILSREAGYRVEQADVKKELFIPEKYFEGSVEEFWRRIPEVDADFEQRRRRLEARRVALAFRGLHGERPDRSIAARGG